MQDLLNVADAEKIFEIVNKDQRQQMLSGILLFLRRGKQTILCVVVDHCLCEDLIVRIALAMTEILIHKRRDLIHI